MTAYLIRSVAFDGDSDSVVIDYLAPAEDVKDNGVVLNHAVMIPATDEFRDLLLDLHGATERALDGALRAWRNADPVDLDEALDDDDAPGPYDHPDHGGQA